MSGAALQVGVHLPQAGPAASGESMRAVAVMAEELGFADVWVSDHLVVPSDAVYPPSAYVYEPLVSLAWVAAATRRVRLGTTVLVLPMRNPVVVAKMLASLDRLATDPDRDRSNRLRLGTHRREMPRLRCAVRCASATAGTAASSPRSG